MLHRCSRRIRPVHGPRSPWACARYLENGVTGGVLAVWLTLRSGGMSRMPTFASVDDYIAAQSAEAQPRLRELRAIFRAALPEADEVISYDLPAYKFGAGFVYFGAAKRHCAI